MSGVEYGIVDYYPVDGGVCVRGEDGLFDGVGGEGLQGVFEAAVDEED